MAAAFPGATFPLAADPAFDALDFGVAGRLLARGGAFAMQNAEGLALDLAPAGPLTRVRGPAAQGSAAPPPPPRATPAAAAARGGGAKRRRRDSGWGSDAQGAAAADEDGQFGDDEKEALDEGELLPEHLREGSRGSAVACAALDDGRRAFVLHAGGRALDELGASRLEPCGRSWRLSRLATGPGSVAESAGSDGEGEDGGGHSSSRPAAQQRERIVQVSAASHGDPGDLAWVATRSRKGAAFYRLRHAAASGAGGSARGLDSVALACVGGVRADAGAGVADVVLNPYWGGEAALLDSAGLVKLWGVGSETVEAVGGPGPDLNAQAMLSRAPPFAEALSTLRRAALEYGQLAWGMHPRTLLCAQAYRLSLLDLRSQGSQELLRMPCAALAQAGRFYSVCGASAAGAPQEFAAVTSSLVCIFDIRQPAMPMIRWLHHQEYDPPRQLSLAPILLEAGAAGGDGGCGRADLGARLLVTGNERWGEVICYQYGPAGVDAALMALEQPRKLLSAGDSNAWPSDGTVLYDAHKHRVESAGPASALSQRRGQAGSDVGRLCGLGVAMLPRAQHGADGSADGSAGRSKAGLETADREDDEHRLPHSGRAAYNFLGVVVQMSETGEVFVQGLERATHSSWHSRPSRTDNAQPATRFGEEGFRGWVDGDFLKEEEAETAMEDEGVWLHVAQGGASESRRGAASNGKQVAGGNEARPANAQSHSQAQAFKGKEGSGVVNADAMVDTAAGAVAPDAPKPRVDLMEQGPSAMHAARANDHTPACGAEQVSAERCHGGGAEKDRAWVSVPGWGRSRQELEQAANRSKLVRPVRMSVAGNRVFIGYDEAHDLSRVFEFAAGLRGFDGKVAEGVRLPDPPFREHNRWVCEICGFRVCYKRALSAVEKRTNVTRQGAGSNRMHVCANCNSAWHARCIEQLYVVRKERSLKESRKVPKMDIPHWICPQCTFYAEERARAKVQHLARQQWRDKLKKKKVRVPVNRHEPGGGAWGAADAFIHDVEKSFQGLGVAEPKGRSDSGYLELTGDVGSRRSREARRRHAASSTLLTPLLHPPLNRTSTPLDGRGERGEFSAGHGSTVAASAHAPTDNVMLRPWTPGERAETGGSARARGKDSCVTVSDSLAAKLVEFVKWPPKTMLEILVYVRRDMGMATLSLSDLALCLRKLSTCPSSLASGEEGSWGDEDAPVVAMQGHAMAVEAASSLLAQLPDSESVESVSRDKSVSLAQPQALAASGHASASGRARGFDVQERGVRLEHGALVEQGSLLRHVCSLVFVARTGVESTTLQWRGAAALANAEVSRDGDGQGRTKRTHVNTLSDDAVCDIFLQRPKDQYEDVAGSDGEVTTRQVFDRLNRRKPFARRRPGHPNKKPDGPDSTLRIIARRYSVDPGVVYSIWMRKTRKAVTRALRVKGALKIKTRDPAGPLSASEPECGAAAHGLSAPGMLGQWPAQKEGPLEEADTQESGEAAVPGLGSASPILRRSGPDADDDGAGECVCVCISVRGYKNHPASGCFVFRCPCHFLKLLLLSF